MGRNQFGQLGDSNTSNQHSPIEIASADVVAVSAGNEFVLFIKGDGSLWGTGRNHQGNWAIQPLRIAIRPSGLWKMESSRLPLVGLTPSFLSRTDRFGE